MPEHPPAHPPAPARGPDVPTPRPRVALETTVLSHGLPWPANRDLARDLHAILSDMGVDAATAGVLGGALRCDLTLEETLQFCDAPGMFAPVKTSLANLPGVLAQGDAGATTVATTMLAAHRASIRVMATT
ncbi:MAG: hypothetical protein COV99_09505 [Bacteroidetes bacterium CG12_big_fil_rev_8_21_14_0_65_60_17]|nr:MAG: hypothetical protein COV99_09505 [Bacteroidetes bacterium CG12_big_fil_rev_8_21_14_0_65_60_17]